MTESVLNNWPWFVAGWVAVALWAKGTERSKDLIRRHDAAMLKLSLSLHDQMQDKVELVRCELRDHIHHATALVLKRIDDALPIAEEIP